MAVGKPDFDLNSFGVKYLSKDQVQDFLEIKKFGKNIGDTPDPVEETTDKDGNVIQKKPHPQKLEVFTDIQGLNPHQNPTAIDGGGYPGKWRRTGKKDKDGNPIKYQQTEEGTKPKVGQVPTSRKNNVQYGKLGEESTEQVKESFDYHTNSPKWQEAINRDAELTTEQGTEKFDDTPANRALRDRIAAREHKKKLAAEKKKKLKKANDIIMDMNIMKLDLMKDSKDGKQSKDGLPIRNGELKDLISGDDTREHVAEATRLGNEKRDIDEEFKKRYGFKNTPKNWKRFGRKNRMSGGTKESLKSDLMKDALDPKAKPQEDLLGNPNTALPKNTRVGQKPPKVIDMGDSEMDYGTGEQFGNPFHGSTTRPTAQGIKNQNKPRYQSTDPNAKYYKNSKVGSSGTDPHKPRSADAKNTYKSAEETIFKAISLKSDLMKDGIQGGGKNVPIPKKDGDEDDTWKQNSRGQGLGETDTIWAGYPFAPPETRPGGRYPEKPDMKGAPKDLKTKAEETILKAISLKLDLMKDAPKDLEREGIKKRPSNMPKAGKRDFEITPDQEEAARRGDFGNPITGHDKESAMTRLSDSERDWKAGHENAYGTRPINNPEGELIPPSVHNQRMGSTTKMKDEN